MPAPASLRHRLRALLRGVAGRLLGAGKIALVAVLLLLSVPTLASAFPSQDIAPMGPMVGDPFLNGSFDLIGGGTGAGWTLVESPWGLGDIDPVSGALLSDDVSTSLSPQLAIEHDLMQQQQLAIDQADIARRAKEALERRRKQLGVAVGSRSDPGTASAADIINFTPCGASSNTKWMARPEAVYAWEALCRAAVADGLNPLIESGWRDPVRQKELYREAIAKYGSEKEARKWVAFSDGVKCSSRHCSGIAIDVNRANGMEAWMHRIVGCYNQSTSAFTRSGSCPSGQIGVKQVQMYGFVLPMDHEPWHIELGIPINAEDGGGGSDCDPDRSLTVPQMIGSIWRCRLGESGITGNQQAEIVARAVVVAKCESGWNSQAIAFGGKYVNSPHPSTGSRYTAAGVFQFIKTTANSWITGGYANVHDPVANIDGAARYFLSGYRSGGIKGGFGPWACAAVNDGFAKSSVIPEYGGPAIPDWAYQY